MREHSVQPVDVPPGLAPLVRGYGWGRNIVGESGDAVYRLHSPAGGADLYLKHAHGPTMSDLSDEMARLLWLARNLPVPRVLHFTTSADDAWLLTTALPGETAYQRLESHPDERFATVDALAGFLRRLHAVPIASCPFNSDHRLRMGEARWRLDAGRVDVADFEARHRGLSGEQLWDEMIELLPLAADPVVTHGDFSLDNIIMDGADVVGCIDVGRAGIADRYQDLAILWNCLGEFGPALQARMFRSYGIDAPDDRRIRFHLDLDALS